MSQIRNRPDSMLRPRRTATETGCTRSVCGGRHSIDRVALSLARSCTTRARTRAAFDDSTTATQRVKVRAHRRARVLALNYKVTKKYHAILKTQSIPTVTWG